MGPCSPARGQTGGPLHWELRVFSPLDHQGSPLEEFLIEMVSYLPSITNSITLSSHCPITLIGRLFIYLFSTCLFKCLAALGLRCCVRAFSSFTEKGLLSRCGAVHGLLTVVASLVREHGLGIHRLQWSWHGLRCHGSPALEHRPSSCDGLSCSVACEILLNLVGGFLTTGPTGTSSSLI